MVEQVVANHLAGVRFSLSAQRSEPGFSMPRPLKWLGTPVAIFLIFLASLRVFFVNFH